MPVFQTDGEGATPSSRTMSIIEVYMLLDSYHVARVLVPYIIVPLACAITMEWAYQQMKYRSTTVIRNVCWYATAMCNGAGLLLLLRGF